MQMLIDESARWSSLLTDLEEEALAEFSDSGTVVASTIKSEIIPPGDWNPDDFGWAEIGHIDLYALVRVSALVVPHPEGPVYAIGYPIDEEQSDGRA